MQALVLHLVRPLVKHPDEIRIQTVEGEAVVTLEMTVHADDRAIFDEDGGRTLRAIRNVISAAAGQRKATLDLVEAHTAQADSEE